MGRVYGLIESSISNINEFLEEFQLYIYEGEETKYAMYFPYK